MGERAADTGCDAITNLFARSPALDQSGIPQNSEVMGYMRLRAVQLQHELRDAGLFDEQALKKPQPGFVGQGLQDGGALTRSAGLAGDGLFHQQQLPVGEQVTASPPTVCPARLMIAKCGAYRSAARTVTVFEQISNGSPRR